MAKRGKGNNRQVAPNQRRAVVPMRAQNPPVQSATTTQKQTHRSLWEVSTPSYSLGQGIVDTDTQAPANETKYLNASISFDLEDYFDTTNSNYLERVDQFRFDKIDVYCQISNLPFNGFFRSFNIYYKADYDDNVVINWLQLQERDCVQRKTLNPTTDTVMVKLMTIKPSANFRASSLDSNPANAILPANTWFDVIAKEQNFVGIKVHIEVNSGASETFVPRVTFPTLAHMSFRGQK